MKRFNLLQMLQSIGRSLMIPIAMLPAAGILLAFGVSFQDPNIVASLPFLGADWLVHVLKLMAEAGSAIFANLPLLFAVGVAVGLSDDQDCRVVGDRRFSDYERHHRPVSGDHARVGGAGT
ncbi:hypothetical protein ECZU29_32130 [Escherichia coli]|nr:hypothetical protein ECZU29_32130 [Escherichia coli]